MEDRVGGTFLVNGGWGGQRGWPFATYVLGGVKCRNEPAEHSRRLATLTKKKSKRSVHRRSQESYKNALVCDPSL